MHSSQCLQVGIKQVDNFYAVTALSWKPDGSKLCVGGMTGVVDVYDACVRVSNGSFAGCGHVPAFCLELYCDAVALGHSSSDPPGLMRVYFIQPVLQRHKYKGKFEFTYVSKSAVIVKELKSGKRIVLKSVYGYEVDKINIYRDR